MARVDSSYLCIDKKKIETRKQWCFFMHYSKHWKLVEIMIHTKIQSYHHLEEMLYVMNDTCFHLASLCSPVQNCCCVWGHCFLVFGSSKKSWLWCWWWVLVQTGLSLASRIASLQVSIKLCCLKWPVDGSCAPFFQAVGWRHNQECSILPWNISRNLSRPCSSSASIWKKIWKNVKKKTSFF